MSGESDSVDRPSRPGAPTSGARQASAWAPLRLFPVFRALWIAQFASNVGTWMQTVGAQWLLVDRSPLLVSLVQTASTLPIVLLTLPAGAWADLADRRRLLLGAQVAMFVAAAALAATTFLGAVSPALILALTFALGCGNAVASPAWQAIQPDLVDRGLLPQAAALNGLMIFTPDAADGPVLVTPTYRVAEDDAVAFTEAMRHVGRSHRRTGALRWELFRDGNDPTRFVESYLVGTWAEHLRQHESRLTGADRKVRGPGVPLCAR